MFIESDNLMHAVVHTVIQTAPTVESRIGPTKEMVDVSVTFEAGTFYTRPGMNQWIGWTEVAQLIAGSFDWNTFKNVAPKSNLELFTENMAYGPRIKRQWEETITELSINPLSRRAVMFVGDANEALFNRPCTNSIQFLIRDDRLVTLVHMRSWDLFKGLPYDIMMFSALALITASILNVRPGEVTVTAGSAHVYESDYDRIDSTASKWKAKRMQIETFSVWAIRERMAALDRLLRESSTLSERKTALEVAGIEVVDVDTEATK